MTRSQFGISLAMIVLVFCTFSCSTKEKLPSSGKDPRDTTSGATATAADTLGSELIPPEAISNEVVRKEAPGSLTLPTTFGHRTGDLDQMIKERRIRALVMINPISFFYSRGKPKGLKYEMLEQFQSVVNRQFKTKTLKVRVTFIPMRPDELGLALTQGVGDVIAEGVWITPGRQEHYAFTTPTKNNVTEIIVTGKELANTKSFDDLVGKDIYVNPLTTAYTNLNRINDQRSKVGKTPLQVKAVDKNLLEDDLIEMVNAGLLPATVAMQHRAGLWEQVLPNIKLHEDMVVGSGGQLGWVVRKDNPKLKQLLDKFIAEYGEGTSFGNTLLRRYLQNQKWIKNSTAEEEMRKFGVYVELFKKYATQYNFDYLMITAQAYQESTLDQSKRSHAGAVGIMQVIPKYAAAHPIRIPDVSKPDKNILAGVRIMNYILTNFVNDPAIDPVNKTLLTFASYNAGPTRIARLRRQAQQHGMDPNKWFGNVELEVAKDIGEETVTYVDNIYKYYVAYKLAADRIEDLQKAKLAAK